MPALPGVFAGEAGWSAVTEPVGPENDRPSEKRKVDSSILSLTTTLRTISQPSYLRRQQEERDSHGARGADEIQDQHKSNTTGLRPCGSACRRRGQEVPRR